MPEEEVQAQDQTNPEEFLGQGEEGAKPSGSNLKTLITLVLSAVIAGAAGLLVVFFVLTPASEAGQKVAAPTEEPPKETVAAPQAAPSEQQPDATDVPLYDINGLIVNVSGSDMRRYLKLDITLMLSDQKMLQKLQSKPLSIKVTDRLISILSDKTVQELDGYEMKDKLRHEIRIELSELLGSPDAVRNVYFKEMLVQ